MITDIKSNIPPNSFKRNSHGLFENLNYFFDDDGYVDWRKMLKPEHLVPDKNKTTETDISLINDEDLLILLPGLKYLANIRGYRDVDYQIIHSDPNKIAVKCTISWIANYETENREIVFSSLADASRENTEGFASIYLATIAENRAFVRCVRNFLRIKIVAKEELKNNTREENDNAPTVMASPEQRLITLMAKGSLKFSDIKNKLIAEGKKEAAGWEKESDIPKTIILELISRISKKLKEQKQ